MIKVFTCTFNLIMLLITVSTVAHAQESVLASGKWAKLGVSSKGIFKIDFETLRNAGFDPASVEVDKIQLFGQAGGMLPQSNAIARPFDLVENSYYTVGLDDNSFDGDDYILFYSEGPDTECIDQSGHLVYQKNLYADTSYYFLTVGPNLAKGIGTSTSLGEGHPEINKYTSYHIHELDQYNILSSGREWYGESISSSNQLRIDFENTAAISPGSEIEIVSSFLNRTEQPAAIDIWLNSVNAGTIAADAVGTGTYDDKGVVGKDTLIVNGDQIEDSGNLNFRIAYQGPGNGFFDYLAVSYPANLEQLSQPVFFTAPESTSNSITSYRIDNASPNTIIWDVTDPNNILVQEYKLDGNQAIFSAPSTQLKEFVVFEGDDFDTPMTPLPVENQNLHGMSVPDLLIVTHSLFLAEAQRLADFRTQNDELNVQVVTVEQVYNEFSSGRQDVTAIRDLAAYLHKQDQEFRYLLLFGRCSYDYKNLTADNTNFVPTYQSRNSLDPIYSYNSDDYYGFLDEDEGIWAEDLSGTGGHQLDISVGRLPVTTAQEARLVVDKLIHYASSDETMGSWRQDIYYIADDGDFNLHQRDADRLAIKVDTSNSDFNVHKIYMDAYPQEQTPNGEASEAVNQALEDAFKKGALIVNYTGHGSEYRWAEETILSHNSINSMTNRDKLPLFVTATCEFGRYDDPNRVSGAEKLILNQNGGAIGLVTTARPVFASKNFILNEAFYEIALEKTESGYSTLGEIFSFTKNDSYTIVANRNFALLGDPSMKLAYPEKNINITEISNDNIPGDTIKALSTVKVAGEVVDSDGETRLNYTGIAEITVFDKHTETETLGSDGGRTFTFEQRNSTIFRGEVSIESGQFEAEFVVPKNINYENGTGKISVYALSTNGLKDAGGAESSFFVDGYNKNPPLDNTPPEITLYMDDSSFANGGSTGRNPTFLARITDESGVNISSKETGENIIATLNSEREFVLNDFFKADLDSYQSGWVRYPLTNLEQGKQEITLTAFDVHGNSSEATLEFYVYDGSDLTIGELKNYPNPFNESTTFHIDHNQPGSDLEVTIRIFDIEGKLVHQILTFYENSPSTINDLSWNGTNGNGVQIKDGIYLYQAIVKSITSGHKNVENQKMILIK